MRKCSKLALFAISAILLCGCSSNTNEKPSEAISETSTESNTETNSEITTDIPVETTRTLDYTFSDDILLSINNGAAGYGTEAETTDAIITIYTDGTIKV